MCGKPFCCGCPNLKNICSQLLIKKPNTFALLVRWGTRSLGIWAVLTHGRLPFILSHPHMSRIEEGPWLSPLDDRSSLSAAACTTHCLLYIILCWVENATNLEIVYPHACRNKSSSSTSSNSDRLKERYRLCSRVAGRVSSAQEGRRGAKAWQILALVCLKQTAHSRSAIAWEEKTCSGWNIILFAWFHSQFLQFRWRWGLV